MSNAIINSFLKWLGRGLIGIGFTGGALWLGSKWGNACDKATAENRLVGEKNADRVGDYVSREALPQVANVIVTSAAQEIGKAMSSSPQKS